LTNTSHSNQIAMSTFESGNILALLKSLEPTSKQRGFEDNWKKKVSVTVQGLKFQWALHTKGSEENRQLAEMSKDTD
jgi:hypothetical protein